jgi:hypothetical protein
MFPCYVECIIAKNRVILAIKYLKVVRKVAQCKILKE